MPDGWARGGGGAEPSNPLAQGFQEHNKRKLPCAQTVTDTHVLDTRVLLDNARSRPESSHRSVFNSGAHVGLISLSALTRKVCVSVPTFQTQRAAFWCQGHSTLRLSHFRHQLVLGDKGSPSTESLPTAPHGEVV